MLYSLASTDGTRWHRLVITALAALLILASVTAYSLLAHRHHATDTTHAPTDQAARAKDTTEPTREKTPKQLGSASDPATFAHDVAEALFDWDTNTLTTPSDLIERLVAVNDPTGQSAAGLVADVTNYLPTTDAWTELRRYETRQRIEITSAEVPSLWSTAVQQAGPKGLKPGTTAYTIHGIRHRAGIWDGAPVSTTHDVSFTVFIVCGPSYPECHLLRLSRLDDPLG